MLINRFKSYRPLHILVASNKKQEASYENNLNKLNATRKKNE